MTAQTNEILILKGKTYKMASEPISQFIIKNKIELRLNAPSSALWRG
jgi:hypothetical protein